MSDPEGPESRYRDVSDETQPRELDAFARRCVAQGVRLWNREPRDFQRSDLFADRIESGEVEV